VIQLLLAVLLTADQIALDNEYVRVARDAAPCAAAKGPECGQRVIVALGGIVLAGGMSRREMTRGDIAVFQPGESYEPPIGGAFFEVAIKPNHPPVQSPGEIIAPERNAMRYDGEQFFVFEEKLAPGETRPRHSHSQRVVMQLNRTRLEQWLDGRPPIFVETVPERVSFNPPVIHVVKNVGDAPLWGIVIEFKPERAGAAPSK
jgi:quercetin dioxygenase-like cupin family protein